MRQILVDCCEHCPLRQIQEFNNYCTYPDTEGWEIEDVSIIAVWCKLKVVQ